LAAGGETTAGTPVVLAVFAAAGAPRVTRPELIGFDGVDRIFSGSA
jgi:hypothetical protein